jgi:hypothetical protein
MTTTTPDAMRLRFPEFAAQTDAALGFAIEEAELAVDDPSWVTPANALNALMLRAAHYIATGLMTAESGTGQIVESESITGLGTTTFARVPLPPEACDLEATVYGRRYLDLVRANFSGGAVI